MMQKKKSIMLMIIFASAISFWVIGTGRNTALKAEEAEIEEAKNKIGLTKPKLEDIVPILKKILPPASEFKESKEKCNETCLVDYLSFDKGEKVGIITVFKLEGQWGPMVILLGVNMDGEITHMELAYHTETPGCGSQVDRRPFLDQFKGKTVKDPMEIYKDLLEATDAVKGVDCITRATISSEFIAKGVKKHLKTVVEHYLSGKEDVWK